MRVLLSKKDAKLKNLLLSKENKAFEWLEKKVCTQGKFDFV